MKHGFGAVLGLVTLTVTSWFNTLGSTAISCFSYTIGFFLLGLLVQRKFREPAFKWIGYWSLILPLLLLALSNFSPGARFTPFEILAVFLISISYLAGLLVKPIRVSFLIVMGILAGTYWIVLPYYHDYSYQHSFRSDAMIGKKVKIEGNDLIDPHGKPISASHLDRDKPTLLIFSFINCKPCRQQKKVITNNLAKIKRAYNIVIVQPSHLNAFSEFKEESKKYPGLPMFYDKDNRLTTLFDSTSRAYPTELRLSKEGIVVNQLVGFSNETKDNYLNGLFQEAMQ